MMISSDIVGLPLREYRTEITWRQTTNYAAGIGDMNSLFTDDCREEGITAHPIFVVALSWPIIQNLYDYIKLPFELSILQTMVHYTQSLEFNRPVTSLCIRLCLHRITSLSERSYSLSNSPRTVLCGLNEKSFVIFFRYFSCPSLVPGHLKRK
jgi:hypothetical protein